MSALDTVQGWVTEHGKSYWLHTASITAPVLLGTVLNQYGVRCAPLAMQYGGRDAVVLQLETGATVDLLGPVMGRSLSELILPSKPLKPFTAHVIDADVTSGEAVIEYLYGKPSSVSHMHAAAVWKEVQKTVTLATAPIRTQCTA